MKKTYSNCEICQFEDGEHSFECPKYEGEDLENPLKEELEDLDNLEVDELEEDML